MSACVPLSSAYVGAATIVGSMAVSSCHSLNVLTIKMLLADGSRVGNTA